MRLSMAACFTMPAGSLVAPGLKCFHPRLHEQPRDIEGQEVPGRQCVEVHERPPGGSAKSPHGYFKSVSDLFPLSVIFSPERRSMTAPVIGDRRSTARGVSDVV